METSKYNLGEIEQEEKKEQDREWLSDLVKLIVLIWSASLLTF